MATKYSKCLKKSFSNAVHLVDSLRNLINKHHVDLDDLNTILVYFKDSMNADFIQLIKLLDIYTEQKDHKYLDKIENELTSIETKYYDNFDKIFIVDDEFLYKFPSEVVLHILSIIEFSKTKTDQVSLFKSLERKIVFNSRISSTVNNNKVNLNFFDSEILNALPSTFKIEELKPSTENIKLEDIIKIFQFLLEIKKYKGGDQVFSMQSNWISKNGKTRWRQADFSEIIKSKSTTKHYVDLVSDDDIIYRFAEGPSKLSISETKQFRKIDNQWVETKTLQNLIG
ncbi:MAG: hypothetical protein ACON4X_05480 [Polaribacter sp.]